MKWPNIREWHRAAPDAIVIRFAGDITNELIEALPKALMAALAENRDEGRKDRTAIVRSLHSRWRML